MTRSRGAERLKPRRAEKYAYSRETWQLPSSAGAESGKSSLQNRPVVAPVEGKTGPGEDN